VGQGYNTLSLNQGATLSLVLNWDAYPSTTVDYDLVLYDGIPGQGGQEVASSKNRQSGKGPFRYPYPVEMLDYTAPTAGTYYVVVSKVVSSDPNLPMTLFSMNHNLDVRTPTGSILQAADCYGVIGTGATNLTDGAESFSSEGPTKDGRPKPEISAPDRVQTSRTSSFAGTSASAPHAAGAFALLKTQHPELDNVALLDLMTTTAHDVHTAGFDYRTGHGRISLDADQDGLNHDQELSYGTDPLSVDTDGDGFKDGVEVSYGSDPLDPDVIPDLVFGDLNNDGLVDTADVLLARRIVLGLSTPTEAQILHGDVAPLVGGVPSPDGAINAGDLLLIQGKALGELDF
jgi:subtilisin family serine protease